MKASQTNGVRWKIRKAHLTTEELPFHEWLWTGEPIKADRIGRRNGRMHEAHWARVHCIYEACPAEALIRIQDMVDVIPVLQRRPRTKDPE